MRPESSKLENLRRALQRLEDFLAEPVKTERDESGVVHAFEFTFELLWKVYQEEAESQDVRVASPRVALRFALRAGLLEPSDEEAWARMLEDRNLIVHTYKRELAHEVFLRIRDSHAALIRRALSALETAVSRSS
jgi:nucleotidyltransferase substrate binding protein (TIGR01987 family)